MKIRHALISALVVVLWTPLLAEAAKLTLRTRGAYSDGNADSPFTSVIVTAACEANEVTTGGGCHCYGQDTNLNRVNLGYQMACSPVGDGKSFSGFCATVPGGYDLEKAGPGITVRVHCLGPLRANTAGSMSKANPKEDDLIEMPYDQINQSDLSLPALQAQQILERQAKIYAEKMMQHQEPSQ